MKALIFLCLFIPSAVSAATVTQKSATLPESLKIEEGRTLYQENGCVHCHGAEGRGDGPVARSLDNQPRNFQDYEEMKRMPTIRMEQAIKNGLKDTAMPAFKNLSDSQINALIAYLRSFLVKSYTTLTMCAFQTLSIDAKNVGSPFSVELDEPDKYSVKTQGNKILFKGKVWPELLAKKTHRTHFRIMKKGNIHSVVAVKINRCNTDLIELLKTLPCENSQGEKAVEAHP